MSGSVARRAGVAAPAVRGWGRQERVTKKASPWGACDHPQRIRVKEFSRNGMRKLEGAAQLSLKNKVDPGSQECGSGMRPPRFQPT